MVKLSLKFPEPESMNGCIGPLAGSRQVSPVPFSNGARMLPVVLFITFLLAGCGGGGRSSVPQATLLGAPSQISPASPAPGGGVTPTAAPTGAPTGSPTSAPISSQGAIFPNSFLSNQIESNPPLQSYSGSVAGFIAGFSHPLGYLGASVVNYSGGVASHNGYTFPIYTASSSDPTVTISCSQPSWGCPTGGYLPGGALSVSSIHIPAHAWTEGPTPGCSGDCHLAVIDTSHNPAYVCDFYQAANPPASQGYAWQSGNTFHVTSGSCFPQNMSGVPAGASVHGHISPAGANVRASEIASGTINHAISIAVNCANDPFIYPANSSTDQSCGSGSQYPHYGDHFWLDCTDAEINALPGPNGSDTNCSHDVGSNAGNMDANTKTIYRALHDFGAYVTDTGYGDNSTGFLIQVDDDVASVIAGQGAPWASLMSQEGVSPDSSGRYRWWLSNSTQSGYLGSQWWANHLHMLQPCVAQSSC
jgi:hypothetical protein